MVLEEVYIPSTPDRFPEWDCIIQDESDRRIFYSNNLYEVLAIDLDVSGWYAVIRGVRPYTCDGGANLLLGWMCQDGSYIDNLYNSIHGDKQCVIGYLTWSDTEYCEAKWREYMNEYKKSWS